MNLNLANRYSPHTIKFDVVNFPDGQQDIIIKNPSMWSEVTIKSRFNSFRDLELIICANKALIKCGVEKINLYIPYLLGSRSDRKFNEGGTSYLVDVIAPILNAQNFKSVICVDAHSDVAAACINNLRVVDNSELVKWAMSDIYDMNSEYGNRNSVLVSPDAGALKKIYNIAKEIEHDNIIVASKHREVSTGKILSTEIEITEKHSSKDFIIIDDICDGGRTFIELAKAIRQKSKSDIYLIITHGIFSAGLKELSQHFKMIFTTNSIIDNSDLEFLSRNENFIHKLKKIDIFNYTN